MDEVEQKVNSFKQYSDEVKKISVLWQLNKIDDTLANEFCFFHSSTHRLHTIPYKKFS